MTSRSGWAAPRTLLGLLVVLAAFGPSAPAHADTFVVKSTADGGTGTLRRAITQANGNAGADTIRFRIPGAGVKTIKPQSRLPEVTGTVTVNGYSQPGASPNTLGVSSGDDAVLLIQLNGVDAGSGAPGLNVRSDDSTISGLAINRFGGAGVRLAPGTNGSDVAGSFIGTDADGTQSRANETGVAVVSSGDNTIGGVTPSERNLISGNSGHGILFQGEPGAQDTERNAVRGNYIGTDRSGTVGLANGQDGVHFVDAGANTVGGAQAALRNVISANGDQGVEITGPDAIGNSVIANHIGTDAAGTADLGNNTDGVQIVGAPANTIGGTGEEFRNVISGNGDDGVAILEEAANNNVFGNYIGTDADGTVDLGNTGDGVQVTNASGSRVGLSGVTRRNVISGNSEDGVHFSSGVTDGSVRGNFIGTDESGDAPLGNGGDGVEISGSDVNVVGGATSERNVISANGGDGVVLFGADASDNVVKNNFIGVGQNGTTALGNDDGIVIVSASESTIGGSVGSTPGTGGNRIAHNDGDGVLVFGGAAVGNTILSNSTFSNSGGAPPPDAALGIDLGPGGVTENDDDDPDAPTSNNRRQNFPVITSAVRFSNGVTTIAGSLNSNPSQSYRIQCFVAAPDPSGNGEGASWLADADAQTGANGNDPSWQCSPGSLPVGTQVTATATNTATGDTSEFSDNRVVVPVP